MIIRNDRARENKKKTRTKYTVTVTHQMSRKKRNHSVWSTVCY